MREEETKQVGAMTAPPVLPPVAAPQPEKPVKQKKKKEPKPVEPLDELPISVPGAEPAPTHPTATTGESSDESPEPDATPPDTNRATEPVILKPPGKDKPSDLLSDTYNGAVMENYKWSQTMTDVDVRVPLAAHTKAADVRVDIRNDYLRVELLKPERKVCGTLLNMLLSLHINQEESIKRPYGPLGMCLASYAQGMQFKKIEYLCIRN